MGEGAARLALPRDVTDNKLQRELQMASTPEGKVKDKIKAYLKTVPGCWWFMPIGGAYTSIGIPDIVGCVHGVMFAIEVKAPGKLKNLTPLQAMKLAEMEHAGAVVMVADDVQTVRDVFELHKWA